MAHRLTPKGARRRRELMDTAARAFAADGYHTTSVSTIVNGIGVGKGVFYWYFESKDQLFEEILADSLRSMRLAQREAIAGEPDPARRIEQGIRATLRWLSEHRHLFTLIEFARTEERFSAVVRHGDQQLVADALPHVSAGITAGLLRGEDPVILTAAILGVTSHLARVLVLERGDDADRVAEAAIDFCRRGYLSSAVPSETRRIA
jgi:AcrR family transcriptional regulator